MKKLMLLISAAVVSAASADTIAYWPFGTNGFNDVSGNGHNLISATVAESDDGYITLNGTSQFLQTADALDLSGETAVTFECWTKMTAENKTVPLLMCNANPTTGTGGFVIYYGKSAHKFQAQYRMNTSEWQMELSKTASQLQDGAWHHVAYVIDRSKAGYDSVLLYVDGEEQAHNGGAKGAVPALFNDTFLIGGGSSYVAGDNFWTGHIDDVRISRGALTPDHFLKYPTVGKAMRADDGKTPVVAYWPFGGKRGKDATGNGFDLRMDDTVPMLSGTPNPNYNDRNAFTNFYLASFPFSAFSKAGVTIECFARSASSPGSETVGNILLASSKTSYYNYPGAFRFAFLGTNTVSTSFKRVGVSFAVGSGKYASSLTTERELGALNDGRWRHFAIVYDPSKAGTGIVTLYVDGVAATDTKTDATQGAFALRDDILYFAHGLYGQFDDVRISAGALTPDQFLPSRSEASMVALYRFDNGSLDDVSGNGNELSLKSGMATFGDGGYPTSGTGLVMTGKNAGKEWLQSAMPIDLTYARGLTVEFDFNGAAPSTSASDGSSLHVLAATANATTEKGGWVVYRAQNKLAGQFRKDASGWLSTYQVTMGAELDGYSRGRYVVNATVPGTVGTKLWANDASNSSSQSDTLSSIGNLTMCFGSSPTYGSDTFFKGKYLRIALSDVVLDPADFVLDNLINPEEKQTLAYWDFKTLDGITADGVGRRGGGLEFNGSTSATTTNLTLSALTQATIECFVCFGATPSSGTLLSLGSGVGSFALASDATANTLAASFIPYDHLAASNGGAAALAPLAGRKVYHHVALVIDRTKSGADAVRFYVDGIRTTPAGRAWDKSATILDGSITIGEDFTGRIDDLRVSAGALEPGEFLQSATYTPDGMVISIQ